MLPDDRFVIIGGEYNYNYDYYKHDGKGVVMTNQGAIYDPAANSWTCIAAPSGWNQIGDAQSVVLPDGRFMIANPLDNEVAILNTSTNPPTFNSPFTPPGKSANSINDEEGWTLLPDGTILTLEILILEDYDPDYTTEIPRALALSFNSTAETWLWSNVGSALDPLVLVAEGGTNYNEIGPAVLRPDGTVFVTGQPATTTSTTATTVLGREVRIS